MLSLSKYKGQEMKPIKKKSHQEMRVYRHILWKCEKETHLQIREGEEGYKTEIRDAA
jgi:hypothetical protein